MLLLNIISELLQDQTLVGQPKELPCRLKIKVIYFGGFCYLHERYVYEFLAL